MSQPVTSNTEYQGTIRGLQVKIIGCHRAQMQHFESAAAQLNVEAGGKSNLDEFACPGVLLRLYHPAVTANSDEGMS